MTIFRPEHRALHPRRRDVDPEQLEDELLRQAQQLLAASCRPARRSAARSPRSRSRSPCPRRRSRRPGLLVEPDRHVLLVAAERVGVLELEVGILEPRRSCAAACSARGSGRGRARPCTSRLAERTIVLIVRVHSAASCRSALRRHADVDPCCRGRSSASQLLYDQVDPSNPSSPSPRPTFGSTQRRTRRRPVRPTTSSLPRRRCPGRSNRSTSLRFREAGAPRTAAHHVCDLLEHDGPAGLATLSRPVGSIWSRSAATTTSRPGLSTRPEPGPRLWLQLKTECRLAPGNQRAAPGSLGRWQNPGNGAAGSG